MSENLTDLDPETRAQRAEEALAQALQERNELWAQLQTRNAQDRQLEHQQRVIEAMTTSLSWRITAPLRLVKRAGGPLAALRKLLAKAAKR
jgi:uncharacterized protein YhaN